MSDALSISSGQRGAPSPSVTYEPYHVFGEDLILAANGDLLLAGGQLQTQQRLMRRLFTNAGDYIWHLDYGAGLPARVGRKANAAVITGVIRGQLFLEATIAPSPPPTVALTVGANSVVVANVTYTDASTNQPVGTQFPILQALNFQPKVTGGGVPIVTGSGGQILVGS
jgi:hypothetical protein